MEAVQWACGEVVRCARRHLDYAARVVSPTVAPRSLMSGRNAFGVRYWLTVAAVAALYFGSARLGLSLVFSIKQVTAVWPPTGIAFAALLLFGYRIWPGILLGALAANSTQGI